MVRSKNEHVNYVPIEYRSAIPAGVASGPDSVAGIRYFQYIENSDLQLSLCRSNLLNSRIVKKWGSLFLAFASVNETAGPISRRYNLTPSRSNIDRKNYTFLHTFTQTSLYLKKCWLLIPAEITTAAKSLDDHFTNCEINYISTFPILPNIV